MSVLEAAEVSVKTDVPFSPSKCRSRTTFAKLVSPGMSYPPTVSTALSTRSGPPATMAVLSFMAYAPPAVSVLAVIVTVCPLAMLVLSTVRSPPPPVAVMVPCSSQFVAALSYKR